MRFYCLWLVACLFSGSKGFCIQTASGNKGVVNAFHFPRFLHIQQNINNLNFVSITLPGYLDHPNAEYAQANTSIGMNGTVLTNANSNTLVLTKEYLVKASALANIFRKYGIRVFLTARFITPVEIGGLKSADSLADMIRH